MPNSFVIPERPCSWNKLARANRWIYKKEFEKWHHYTWSALLVSGITRPIRVPVRLVVTARWKGKARHDVDNVLIKPVLDQLVRMEYLQDDDSKCIPEIIMRGLTDQEEDSLTIEFQPL